MISDDSFPRFAALPYRPNVGLAIFNPLGEVLLGKRLDQKRTIWQCPQGGIDPGETLKEAGFREMQEEIGTQKALLLGELEETIRYDLPKRLLGKALGGAFRGQDQRWLVLGYTGTDSDINLNAYEPAEFQNWEWAKPDCILTDYPLGFKRRVYQKILPALVEIFEKSGFRKMR